MIDYDIVGDTMDDDWTPMRVTAHMGEPVVYYGDGLHFDGVLAYGAYQAWLTSHDRYELPPIGSEWAIDFALPLAKWAVQSPVAPNTDPRLLTPEGHVWGWCSSMAQADWVAEGIHALRKYPAYRHFRRYTAAKSHHPGLGPMKAKDLPLPTRLAYEIHWYALGDPDETTHLLTHVSHIGKLTHHGMGRVLRWEIEQMGADRSIDYDGRLMRRMPWGYAQDRPGVVGAIRAPYHHFSRCVLSVEGDYD